jgi:hypothetical protein
MRIGSLAVRLGLFLRRRSMLHRIWRPPAAVRVLSGTTEPIAAGPPRVCGLGGPLWPCAARTKLACKARRSGGLIELRAARRCPRDATMLRGLEPMREPDSYGSIVWVVGLGGFA